MGVGNNIWINLGFWETARPFSDKNEMLQLAQVIIPFEFKCMNHYTGLVKHSKGSVLLLADTSCSQVAKGSDLYRADKSTKLCMVVA